MRKLGLYRGIRLGCLIGCFLLCIECALAGGRVFASGNTASEPAPTGESPDLEREKTEKERNLESELYAQAAVLYDAASGRILFEKNGDQFMPVASTTKIMTCILALEYGNENDFCEVSSYAASQPQVHLGLRAGQRLLLRDLLYAMMLESDNDAAVVVAEHIGGSAEAFAGLMNSKAKELGMENTWFVTANGLDQDGNGSTAHDMAILSAYALENDRFLQIISTAAWSFADEAGTSHYSVTNHDAFLSQMQGALGIKTGYTGAAGYCFAGAVWRDGKRLVAVVLATGWPPNKTRKWSDMSKLMAYGLEEYTERPVLAEEPQLDVISVEEGRRGTVALAMEGSLSMLLRGEDDIRVRYSYAQQLTAPVKEGQQVGSAYVYVNGEYMADYPIVTTQADERLTFADYLQSLLKIFLP